MHEFSQYDSIEISDIKIRITNSIGDTIVNST